MSANFNVGFERSDGANRSIANECITRWGKPTRPSEFVTGHASATNVSGHNPDHNGITHGVDIFVGPGNVPEGGGRWLADHLAARADPRTLYVIFADQIASARTGWQFTGSGYGHWDHVHHSTWDGFWGGYCSMPASVYDDTSPWGIAAFTSFSTEQEEIFMAIEALSSQDKTEILTHLRNISMRQIAQQKQIDTIEFKTARYLDTKISAVAEKVVTFEFPKQGRNEKGEWFINLPKPPKTSIASELGWQDAGLISVRKKIEEVKK